MPEEGASLKPRLLLRRLSAGSFNNVRFTDRVRLAEAFGFTFARIEGSHHVFQHTDVPELINLQEVGGEAKPYQLRELLRLAERYNLRLEAD